MARQVTQAIADAWRDGVARKQGNTETDGQSVWLHGNKIVTRIRGTNEVWFSLAGWPTRTTRERINGIVPDVDLWCEQGQTRAVGFKFRKDDIEVPDSGWVSCDTGQIVSGLGELAQC